MRNAMPQMLLEEILQAALAHSSGPQRIVIDLCAGYRSMEKAAIEAGCTYIPIDIRYTNAKETPPY